MPLEMHQTVEGRLSLMESNLSHIEDKITKMSDGVDTVIDNQKKISGWLIGDDDNELNIGVLAELVRVKQRLDKLEKWKDRVVYIIIGMSIVSGIGVARILELLRAFK